MSGLFLVALGLGILGYGLTLPPMPGQRYGAGLFPILLGIALAGFGGQLARQGWKQRSTQAHRSWSWDDWARNPRLAVNMLLVLGMIIVYVTLSERIGFVVLSLAMLMSMFWWFGILARSDGHSRSLTTAFIYVGFVRFLRVPLPRGILSTAPLVKRWISLLAALVLLADPYVIVLILLASIYGLFVGAIPGLTAAMAIALLVPVTFFMPPVPALAVIVTTAAMAIFAGDIPGALLRIPGTPASAAYADEAYAMTKKGQGEVALGAGVVFSAIGGIIGTIVLVTAAPALAEVAIKFSSFEYFWLVCLGLTCGVFIASGSQVKSGISLLLGLFVATIGMENPAAYPRLSASARSISPAAST